MVHDPKPAKSTDTPPGAEPGVEITAPVVSHKRTWSSYVTPETYLSVGMVILCLVLFKVMSAPASVETVDLFTAESLAPFRGKNGYPMYLAILGDVFDVSKGRKKYDESKGGYGFFLGRDASLAFVTGDFEGDLTDNVANLSPEQYAGLLHWRDFYHKEYIFKGRLAGGYFYDVRGQKSKGLENVEEAARQARSAEQAQQELEASFPKCNVRWTEAEGGMVWCSDKWHPRRIFQQLPGGRPSTRCACFADIGWSDIRQIYEGCTAEAEQCRTTGA